MLQYVTAHYSVLQCVSMVVCCSAMQHVRVCYNVLQFIAVSGYGVAATSRLLKITGLFCKRDL